MAPRPAQRPARRQKTRTKSSKQPPLNSEAATKKKRPVKLTRHTRPVKIVEQPVYSPNVGSSEVSDLTEDEEPRYARYVPPTVKNDDEEMGGGSGRPSASISIIDGKTPRQLRAERRSAERRAAERRDEDFTDDEEPVTKAEKGGDQGSLGGVNTQDARGEMDWDSDADAEGEDVAEERVASVKPENQKSPKKTDSSLNAHAGSEHVKRNPFEYLPVPSPATPADDLILDPPGVDAGSEVHEPPVAPWNPSSGGIQTESAARYFEFMKRQQFSIRRHYSPVSSSSSSSSEDVGAFPPVDETSLNTSAGLGSSNLVGQGSRLPAIERDSDDEFYDRFDDGDGGDKDGDKDVKNEIENEKVGEEKNDEWLVYPFDKKIDSALSAQLQKIARAINFLVRAKASGIEAGDFAALAAVSPEQWDELVEAPEYAAEIMAKKLLNLSVADIWLLSERATVLLDELTDLGITIE
ncbi:hypothetical protein F4823DRAFT_329491 [Ustulina deusta]|nr:hypothetical protein F4823DRAFT_329491 [Ustulina deusta]